MEQMHPHINRILLTAILLHSPLHLQKKKLVIFIIVYILLRNILAFDKCVCFHKVSRLMAHHHLRFHCHFTGKHTKWPSFLLCNTICCWFFFIKRIIIESRYVRTQEEKKKLKKKWRNQMGIKMKGKQKEHGERGRDKLWVYTPIGAQKWYPNRKICNQNEMRWIKDVNKCKCVAYERINRN